MAEGLHYVLLERQNREISEVMHYWDSNAITQCAGLAVALQSASMACEQFAADVKQVRYVGESVHLHHLCSSPVKHAVVTKECA